MSINVPWSTIPIIGPWLGRIGIVREIIAQPCTPTPTMWVNAFFNATPVMITALFKPTPTDYLLLRRPRGSPFHGKKRAWRWDVLDVLEGTPADPNAPSWVSFDLSNLVGLLARLEWFFTIGNATSEGLLWWTSLAMKYSGCPGTANLIAELQFPPNIVTNAGVQDVWIVQPQTTIPAGGFGVGIPAGFKASYGCSVTFAPETALHQPISGNVVVRDLDSGQDMSTAKLHKNSSGGFTATTARTHVPVSGVSRLLGTDFATNAFPIVQSGLFQVTLEDPLAGIHPDP